MTAATALAATLALQDVSGPHLVPFGPEAGRACIRLRFGGCEYRCHWCDVPEAVLPAYRDTWVVTSLHDLLRTLDALNPTGLPLLITGGNPGLYHLDDLLLGASVQGVETIVETQGSIARNWMRLCTRLILSPKAPSARMGRVDWDTLSLCAGRNPQHTSLVLSIATPMDWDWAVTEVIPWLDREEARIRTVDVVPVLPVQGSLLAADLSLLTFQWLAREVTALGDPRFRAQPDLGSLTRTRHA